MPASDPPVPAANQLLTDPLLRDAPTVAGFKVLDPVVLYAKVGQGGMGAVYRGRHFKLDLDVAVKCLKPSLCAESPDFQKRFEREARLAASLAHQNVVRVMDVHEKHGLHYLVMEFVHGESARQRVLRKGALAEQEALAIVAGASAGLGEAHARGIVHRDIKPDNLLISHEGRVKLADLGLAKAAAGGEQSLSLASGVMGTPQYMAPEQWETPDVGPAADVWALGASLWYLLVGRHALDGSNLAALARRTHEQDFPSLREARPGLAESTYTLCERCVAPDAQLRFVDARALHKALSPLVTIDEAALADVVDGSATQAALVSPPPRHTLVAIRAAIESGVGWERGDAAGVDFEAPTLPSPGGTMRLPPPGGSEVRGRSERRRRWPWLAALLVAAAGVGGWAAGWFGDDTNWEEVERYAKARRFYWEAKDLLPKPDGLDEAITKFEEVLSLWPAYDVAKEPLAQALDKRAERLQQDDLDAAFVAARRANELLPDDARIAARHQALELRLRERLFAGLVLAEPASLSAASSQWVVVGDPASPLRGRVQAPGYREMQMRWLPRAASGVANNDPAWQTVAVVAGEFALEPALGAGEHTLEIVLRDQLGVSGVAQRRVRIAGRLGDAVTGEWFAASGTRMLPIAAAPFSMGSMQLETDRDDDELQHTVVLTDPFWIGATEVTRAEWLRVMDAATWQDAPEVAFAGDLPANFVDHAAAQQFCERLTERERAAGRLPDGYRYCLPTEAQWEFAARGGNNRPFGAGIEADRLAEWAVFGGAQVQRVGGRKTNAYGLHDVFGNVAEWCADFAMPMLDSDNLLTATYLDGVADPLSVIGSQRVLRGGRYNSPAKDCRAAARTAAGPGVRSPEIGLRVVLAKRP